MLTEFEKKNQTPFTDSKCGDAAVAVAVAVAVVVVTANLEPPSPLGAELQEVQVCCVQHRSSVIVLFLVVFCKVSASEAITWCDVFISSSLGEYRGLVRPG